MPVALHAVGRGAIKKFHFLAVVPELGEVVLTEYVGHHFRRQFFPDLIARFRIARVIE
ncbi:hypothetical protein D3C81_2111180 [compost metagenome]